MGSSWIVFGRRHLGIITKVGRFEGRETEHKSVGKG